MDKPKNKGGRPTTYDPKFCEEVEALGRQGKSWMQMASALRIARSTLYEWKDSHPEFSDALNRARTDSQAKWENYLDGRIFEDGGQGINSPLVKMRLAAMFPDDYVETRRVQGDSERPLVVDAGAAVARLGDLLSGMNGEESS